MYDNLAPPLPHHPPVLWAAPTNPYPLPQSPVPAEKSGGRWLPILSLVLSIVALMVVLGLTAWVAGSGVSSLFGGGGGAEVTLSGQVRDTPVGAALPGPTLATAITDVIDHDFGNVTAMTCPDTASVGQGVVTVCHGAIEGDSWAAVVFFENRQGLFTLQLL
jgi:hypothetical protein